jgi:sugar phosphate isomerase/epimerase
MKPGFRRALSTLGCPSLPLGGALALAASHGIDALELRTLEGTTDLPSLFEKTGLERLRSLQASCPVVQLLVLSTSLKLVRPSEEDRAAFLAFAPWADAMGIPWLRVFDGAASSEPDTVSQAAETVRWWREIRREHKWNVDVIVETHDGLLAAETIRRFCEEAAGVRILWDAHATWRATGFEPHVLWPSIAKHVSHIHVKDSVSRRSGNSSYTYVLPGAGEFPMASLLEALARDGYGNAVSLEWERQWHPDLPPLEDALESAARRRWW